VGGQFFYVGLEERAPTSHLLRAIRDIADEALRALLETFEALYAPMGRPSIPPALLLGALLRHPVRTAADGAA
jgi:hypothetical protein